MSDFETIARKNHRAGKNCAISVYEAFGDVNANKTKAPAPRAEGGKCGAVLAAEQTLREMGLPQEKTDEFDRQFAESFGSLKCAELRGRLNNKCNDYVGTSASMASAMLEAMN